MWLYAVETGLFVIGVYSLFGGEFRCELLLGSKRVTGIRVLPISLFFMFSLLFHYAADFALWLFAGPGGPSYNAYRVIVVLEWLLVICCPLLALAYAALFGRRTVTASGDDSRDERAEAAISPSRHSSMNAPNLASHTTHASLGQPVRRTSEERGAGLAEWTCCNCGESVPDYLTTCWNCRKKQGQTG
jgi:hypothetical protein